MRIATSAYENSARAPHLAEDLKILIPTFMLSLPGNSCIIPPLMLSIPGVFVLFQTVHLTELESKSCVKSTW